MANYNNFLDWVQYWVEQLVDLVESMKAWYNHFFATEEGTTEA